MRILSGLFLILALAALPAHGQQEAPQEQSREAGETGGKPPGPAEARPITVDELKGKKVFNERGEELGKIRNIAISTDEKIYAVIAFGGVLGLGETARIVPVEKLQLRGDDILLPGLSKAELEALPSPKERMAELRDEQQLNFPFEKSAKAPLMEGTFDRAPMIPANELKGRSVYSDKGETLGEITRVVLGRDNKLFAVVAFGDAKDERIVSLDRMELANERLFLHGLAEADIASLPRWQGEQTNYSEVRGEYQARLGQAAPERGFAGSER